MGKGNSVKKQAGNKWIALIVEAVGGALLAALLGYVLLRVLAQVVPASGGGFQDIVAGYGGLAFGSIIGATLGVILTGRYLMYHYGAWWTAAVGAVLGVIFAFALASVLVTLDDLFPFAFAIIVAIVSAVVYGWVANRPAAK